MSEQDLHPAYADSLARFGVVNTSLGRRLYSHQVVTASADQPGPLSHAEQEERLGQTKMWVPHKAFEPAKVAVQGATGYASKLHLPDPHATGYGHIMTNTSNLRDVGRAYDALPTRQASAVPHFEKMRDEIRAQHDHMTKTMGIKSEAVDYDPYKDVHEMVHDVTHNKRLKVMSTAVTGGHDFLSNDDNDKFRAVHDLFGHAATGRGFDAHGEEAAWLAHSRMFTSRARPAMSSETRGQNAALHINGEFQPQKTAILPSHMWGDEAVNEHRSSLMSFEAFLTTAVKHVFPVGGASALCGAREAQKPYSDWVTHNSTCPDCNDRMEMDVPYAARSDEKAPPALLSAESALAKTAHDSGDGITIFHCPFCGSGQVIARSDNTIECQYCNTCFSVTVQPQYSAFPQTIDGQPVQVPGMPPTTPSAGVMQGGPQMPVDPQVAGQPGMDPNDPQAAAQEDPAAPEGEQDDGEGDEKDDGNPFTSSLRADGRPIERTAYLRRLALNNAVDREQMLADLREESAS